MPLNFNTIRKKLDSSQAPSQTFGTGLNGTYLRKFLVLYVIPACLWPVVKDWIPAKRMPE